MKRAFIFICAFIVVLLLPLAAWRTYLAHVINKQLAIIHLAGEPTNGDELNHWYAAVPDNENAALVLTRAFKLLHVDQDTKSNLIHRFKLPIPGKRLSKEQIENLRSCVADNKPCLEKIDEALKLPASRYPVDYTMLANTPLPHLAWLVDIAKLHQFRALLALESGNPGSATTNIETILGLARTLDREPCLISQLVRFSLISQAFDTLNRRISAGPLTVMEINSLSDAFSQTRITNQAALALIGERALTIPYFRMTKAEYAKINSRKDAEDVQRDSPLPCNGPAVLRLLGYYELDYGSYLIGMNKAIALVNASPPVNLQSSGYLTRVGDESTRRRRTITGATFSTYSGVAWRENRAIAQQRIALAALTVESFRNDNGKLPESFKDLTPKYLAKIPDDPFTGTELSYRCTDMSYEICTRAAQRTIVDTKADLDAKESNHKKPDEVTFTVER